MSNYTISTTINQSIDSAVETLKACLMKQHLGIVSEVNVQGIIKNKLGDDIPPYRILGACNPMMAKSIITDEPEAGALLPCTIVVREASEGVTTVDFMDPVSVLGIAENSVMDDVASQATIKIKAAIAELESL